MGFYDEDDIFCNISECNKKYHRPEAKRLRRDKPSVIHSIDFCIPTSDETLDKPDSIDAGCESLQNREEVEARLSNLRRIGLRAHPLQALRRYLLNKVATGEEPNPWVSTVHEEKVFRRKLRRYITGMIIRACREEGVENCQIEPSHTDAFSFIDNINKELVESLAAVGSFTSEQLQCGRSNCQKAFSLRRVASTLVSQINGDYTRCQVPECTRNIASNDDVCYLIIESGCYGHRLEMPADFQSCSKLLCLCRFHNGLFEFMFDFIHMKWNVYHNCLIHVRSVLQQKDLEDSDDMIDELPSNVVKSLVHYYMARYFCFWVFGDSKMWNLNGCTLFQAISGS